MTCAGPSGPRADVLPAAVQAIEGNERRQVTMGSAGGSMRMCMWETRASSNAHTRDGGGQLGEAFGVVDATPAHEADLGTRLQDYHRQPSYFSS